MGAVELNAQVGNFIISTMLGIELPAGIKPITAAAAGEPPLDYRISPSERSNMARYLFAGFKRCLYSTQKFQSDAERKLAVILEREAIKWFKPAKGQFQMFYPSASEYQPDFAAETNERVYMLA